MGCLAGCVWAEDLNSSVLSRIVFLSVPFSSSADKNAMLTVTWDSFTSYLKDRDLEVFYVGMYYSGSTPASGRSTLLPLVGCPRSDQPRYGRLTKR